MIRHDRARHAVGTELMRLGLLIALACAAILGALPSFLAAAAGH